jgi:hypothetical protein
MRLNLSVPVFNGNSYKHFSALLQSPSSLRCSHRTMQLYQSRVMLSIYSGKMILPRYQSHLFSRDLINAGQEFITASGNTKGSKMSNRNCYIRPHHAAQSFCPQGWNQLARFMRIRIKENGPRLTCRTVSAQLAHGLCFIGMCSIPRNASELGQTSLRRR